MAPYNNLTGLKFGKLTVIADTGERKHNKVVWLCKCDCGNTREVIGSHLTTMHTYECEECAKLSHQDNANKRSVANSLHNTYYHMKARCENPKCEAYPYYGGRGISICKEWSKSKEAFENWARNSGYTFGLTIERIDVNGNYCPENCKWVSHREQTYNKRNTVYIHYRGKKVALARVCYDLNLDLERILHYLNKKRKYFAEE